jgi:hypothetical protein
MKQILLSITTLLFTACSAFGEPGVKTSPYEIISTQEPYEIRHYKNLVLVNAPMSGASDNQNSAFFKLFDYISGQNKKNEKIEMTAPVFMDTEEDEYMQFVLPARYTMQTAPIPNHEDLDIVEMKNLTMASIRFSGRLTKSNTRKHREKLISWIKAQENIQIAGEPITAGYNAPFTIPILRRNEVLIPIKKQ